MAWLQTHKGSSGTSFSGARGLFSMMLQTHKGSSGTPAGLRPVDHLIASNPQGFVWNPRSTARSLGPVPLQTHKGSSGTGHPFRDRRACRHASNPQGFIWNTLTTESRPFADDASNPQGFIWNSGVDTILAPFARASNPQGFIWNDPCDDLPEVPIRASNPQGFIWNPERCDAATDHLVDELGFKPTRVHLERSSRPVWLVDVVTLQTHKGSSGT